MTSQRQPAQGPDNVQTGYLVSAEEYLGLLRLRSFEQRVHSLPQGMTRSSANIEKGPATTIPSERNRIDSVARNPRRG